MKKPVNILLTLISMLGICFGQARINFNKGYMVENGGNKTYPVYLVIANANANSVIPGNGWVVSENEFNMVRWFIDQRTGLYIVPFGYNNAYPLPLMLDLGIAGTHGGGSGYISFSTYHTPALNSSDMPSDVTNMGPIIPSISQPSPVDDSYQVVDRFWILDAKGYSAMPGLNNITFSYISSGGTPDETGGANVAGIEPFFLAQRFNPTILAKGGWGDWLGVAGLDIPGGATGTDQSGPVAATDFFRSWTLSSSNSPLPIQISSFTAQCNNGTAILQWTSQTELNNKYYTVKKTSDNIHFETVGTISGAGTSSLPRNYSITDNNPLPETSYYFLEQTDINGTTAQAGVIQFTGCGTSTNVTTINAFNTINYIEIQINTINNDNFNISLVNMLGQTVIQENLEVAIGNNIIRLNNTLSRGVYILNVKNAKTNYTKKLVVE